MKINKEDKAGLYITIIFHLVVIIVLLAYQIDSNLRKEESFVLDFSKQEEIEQKKKELETRVATALKNKEIETAKLLCEQLGEVVEKLHRHS